MFHWRASTLLCGIIGVLATIPPARAQSGLATSPADQVGLCQCIEDRMSRNLFCTVGALHCQASCGSSHYGFVPLQRGAITRCSPPELYVVLPSANGKSAIGGITVTHQGKTILLDSAYAAAGLFGGVAASVPTDAGEIGPRFRAAVEARPGPSTRISSSLPQVAR